MNYKILYSHLSESEIKYYEDINPGWTVKTNNCLLVTFEDGTSMTYIIFVNPMILADAGMDQGAIFVATCLAAAIGCFIMGLFARLPVALAPGMG